MCRGVCVCNDRVNDCMDNLTQVFTRDAVIVAQTKVQLILWKKDWTNENITCKQQSDFYMVRQHSLRNGAR